MLNYTKLHITYSNPNNFDDNVTIDYKLRQTPIAHKWVQRVLTAQQLQYPIDDPARFYGFGSLEQQTQSAITAINQLIDTLRQHIAIEAKLTDVYDQSTLNYLHHIFETQHGLLDAKESNSELQKNLSDLNILVHRCESVARGANPRHVVTYFGLPKTETLDNEDYDYFDAAITFGTVYINYAEIGKTLYDFYVDNDTYIKPEAFQPFQHYSADFVVRFWNDPGADIKHNLQRFFSKNQEYFHNLGYTWQELSRSIGSIPVADICDCNRAIELLESRQFVKAVDFS